MRGAIGGCREQLQDRGAGIDGVERLAGGGETGDHGEPARHRMADQRRARIRGDDEARSDLGQGVDIVVAQHGAGADPGALTVGLLGQGDAFGPARRIERDLDRVEAGVDQCTDMVERFFRRDATQDGDQRQGEQAGGGV
ncbi:hypothetical protein XPN_4026 [Xanthomonas arboricola pv. pruni MAFF 301427]|nr:hypothetical protein XPN_4026 [Xanthomonas arboricola pv. pruni MAFF 301427]